jgi:hypothetical protein
MATYTRASRDFDFVPGQGSSIVIKQYDVNGQIIDNGVILDIESGFIRSTLLNKETTHSGSNGAVLRTRTGADWRFACVLSFPANPIGEVLFVEHLTNSMRSVWVQFNVGDPDFWTRRNLYARSYRGKALLDEVEERFDATGTEVIGLNVSGSGNGLLYPYLDEAQGDPNFGFDIR